MLDLWQEERGSVGTISLVFAAEVSHDSERSISNISKAVSESEHTYFAILRKCEEITPYYK